MSPNGDDNFATVSYECAGDPVPPATMAIASDWLITPAITFHNGDVVSFATSGFISEDQPDRLQLCLNSANTGTNVGASPTSVGDFTTLLLDINPNYATTGQPGTYPLSWTTFTETITGLSGPTSGRLAFRYFLQDGGPSGSQGNEIGIDNVSVTSAPEPCSAVLFAGLLLARRRRHCSLSSSGSSST